MSDSQDYDVVIVGGGICGAIIAKELDQADKRILILEAGTDTGATQLGYQSFVDRFFTETIKVPNSPYPQNPNARSPNRLDVQNPLNNKGGYFYQEGPLPFDSAYTRTLGGTTLHWLGISLRMLPNDFRMGSEYGVARDWPVNYHEMKPYYRRAEWGLAVAANTEDQAYLGIEFDDGYCFPMQRIPPSYVDQVMGDRIDGMDYEIAGHKAKIRIVSLPVSRNSIPNSGYTPVGAAGNSHLGMRCEGNSNCIPICPVQAKFNALKILNTCSDNVSIQSQSIVSKVLFAPDGKVTGLKVQRYADPQSPEHTTHQVTAKRYVLATNAIENPRLMLASDAPNTNGLIGANLMDHPNVLTWGLMPEGTHVGPFRGPFATSGIPTLRDGPFRSIQAAFRVDFGNWGWNFSTGAPNSDVTDLIEGKSLDGKKVRVAYGMDLREKLYNRVQRQFRLGYLVEQLPDTNNRVKVRDKQGRLHRDRLGNPRPVIEYDIDAYSQSGMVESLRVTNAINKVEPQLQDFTEYHEKDVGYIKDIGITYHGAGHLVGTHCMGNNERDSVVDVDSKCWEHENLYLVGCGSMVTIGTSNPTLTAAALTYKSADRLLKELA